MKLTHAIEHLTEELDLDFDDVSILTSVLARLDKAAYWDGWADGQAEALDPTPSADDADDWEDE